MLYVDGPRVYHELSRKFYWSNMIDQIKMICKACEPCQTTKVRRTCSSNELLQNKGTEAFHKWTKPMSGAKISPKSLDGEHEIDTLCLNSIHNKSNLTLLYKSSGPPGGPPGERYFNGNFAESSGNLTRHTRCQRHLTKQGRDILHRSSS